MAATTRGVIIANTTTIVKTKAPAATEHAWENKYGTHKSLTLTNSGAVETTVTVRFNTGSVVYNLIHTDIPIKTTLVLTEEDGLSFDNDAYALEIVTATGSSAPILHYHLN